MLSHLLHRDAVFISLVNCCTSVFAGLAIFCVLGHMAFNLGKEVSEVVTSGMIQYFLVYFITNDRPLSYPTKVHIRRFYKIKILFGSDAVSKIAESYVYERGRQI